MKKNFTRFVFTLFSFVLVLNLVAQCPTGSSASELNWDNLDFLPSNNTRYTSFYPSAAFPYSQNFAMGTRHVNFSMAPAANIILNGENGTNTAHGLSPAVTAGDDVQFTTTSSANSTITISFDLEVQNLQFSVFDLDGSQRIGISAVNTGGTNQPVTMTNADGSSGIALTGTATNRVATGPGTGYGSNDTRGTINIVIAGPVRQVVLTLSNADGDIWLSDIDACITGSFPLSYQQISRPFTGQPQYVLTVVNNNIYYVDPSNGQGYFLFNEPAHNRLNSMAYDPYKRIVYYTFSLSSGNGPQNDKTLRKYDVDSKTISIVSSNVNNLGIPTYESGVESGAASFYNGSLYLGIEGYTGTSGRNSYAASRKSTIWKIDFDAAGNAIAPACQVFGVLADDGEDAQNIHDWSDFGISDGMLYDFDGSQSGDIDYYHFNLMTGMNTNYVPTDGVIPRQVSIGWDEKLYNVDASLGLYDGTSETGTRRTIFAPLGPVIPTGSSASWGDAAGPYRPFLDFGDAPGSYDPDPLSPACHDTLTPNLAGRRTKLILGPAEDVEWLKKGFTTIEDNFEDGLAFVPIYSSETGAYLARVTTLNNTGAAATICAWLDFNGNGIFDAAEGITPITVASSAGVQAIDLSWSGLPNVLPNGSYTYLRIRITSASFNMSTANATGYYSTGEVEDYRVLVENTPLRVTLISFDAKLLESKTVHTGWTVMEESVVSGFEIERSRDGLNWEFLGFVAGNNNTGGKKEYHFSDAQPYSGRSWYRLKIKEPGRDHYSSTRMVEWTGSAEFIRVAPNPVIKEIWMTIANEERSMLAQVNISDMTGNRVYTCTMNLSAGTNRVRIPVSGSLPAGIYIIQAQAGLKTASKKFIIRR